MRLIVDGDQMTRAPDPSLVTLVAKAHVYLEQLTSAPGISVTDVANTHRVHRADVGRLLPLAFLAPRLLDQILSGSQPSRTVRALPGACRTAASVDRADGCIQLDRARRDIGTRTQSAGILNRNGCTALQVIVAAATLPRSPR